MAKKVEEKPAEEPVQEPEEQKSAQKQAKKEKPDTKAEDKHAKKKFNKIELLVIALIALVVILIIIQFVNNAKLKEVESAITCTDVENARCAAASTGCLATETQQEWSCGTGMVCCLKEQEEAPTLPSNSEVINVPQTMCLGGNAGLKCEDSAADAYCKALGYKSYVANSKVCGCPSGSCANGNWANHPTQPLKYNCGSSGSNEWILSMACYKKIGSEQSNLPALRVYLGDSTSQLDGSPLTLTVAETYNFKVYSPNIQGGTNCSISIKDSSGSIINDRTGTLMRVIAQDCVGEELLFPYMPSEGNIGALKMEIIVFKDGKTRSTNPSDWAASLKINLTIVSRENAPRPFTSLPTVTAGRGCTARSGLFTTTYNARDHYIIMQPLIEGADCYLKDLSNVGASCMGETISLSENCVLYNVYEPYTVCGAIRYQEPSGTTPCYFADISANFEPQIDVSIDYQSAGDFIFFTCADGTVCKNYAFRYAFLDLTKTCDSKANLGNAGSLILTSGGTDDPYESTAIPVGANTGKRFCLKVTYKQRDWYNSLVHVSMT